MLCDFDDLFVFSFWCFYFIRIFMRGQNSIIISAEMFEHWAWLVMLLSHCNPENIFMPLNSFHFFYSGYGGVLVHITQQWYWGKHLMSISEGPINKYVVQGQRCMHGVRRKEQCLKWKENALYKKLKNGTGHVLLWPRLFSPLFVCERSISTLFAANALWSDCVVMV